MCSSDLLQLRKLSATEAVTSCVIALVLIYALAAEWLGSVAGITGAYLIGYVFAGSKFKADIERTFHAIGHGLLIPLFFVAIGLTSNFRTLGGHWLLLGVIFVVAVMSKMIGCGLAAMARGLGFVRSLRIGCGMVSRGEVGLIIAAMAMRAAVFKDSEVAMVVAVVLLTTLFTPLALRGAFQLSCPEDAQSLPGEMAAPLDASSRGETLNLGDDNITNWPSRSELGNDFSKMLMLSKDSP